MGSAGLGSVLGVVRQGLGGPRGSLEGPAMLLEGCWKDARRGPARVLGASWQCPAPSETNSDNPASRGTYNLQTQTRTLK